MGVAGFPVAPLLGGLAVVRVAFWCSGAVEPLPGTLWQLVRWRGPPGLADFDFRARFLCKFEGFVLLGLCRFEPASCEHGLVFTVRVSWLWVVCGCSPGPAAPWQPLSRRRWSEKVCPVAGGVCAWIPCMRRQTVTLV